MYLHSSYLHYKNILKGIKYNCDIFVEKPLVIKDQEALNLIKLAKEKISIVFVMHQRYRPISKEIKNFR